MRDARDRGADRAAEIDDAIEAFGRRDQHVGALHRRLVAAHERFVREDRALVEVDDRLERDPRRLERALEALLDLLAIAFVRAEHLAREGLGTAPHPLDTVAACRACHRARERLLIEWLRDVRDGAGVDRAHGTVERWLAGHQQDR